MRELQRKIAKSRWSLPTTAFMAVLVWLASGAIEQELWIQFACFVLSTYMMVELNTTFVLLRTYSRMVSCVFIVLYCCGSFLFPNISSNIVTLCYVVSVMPLFNAYQDKTSAGWTFYTFLLIGTASLFWVHMLFFIPLVWLIMGICLRSLSFKTLMSSLLGIITPYWFTIVYFIYKKDYTTPLEHFQKLTDFGGIWGNDMVQTYQDTLLSLGLGRIACLGFVVILLVVGIIYYIRTKFHDKLNTRMFYDTFITNALFILTFIFLQPQHFDMLYNLLIVAASPVIARYITHTRTFFTNISFLVMAITALVIIVLNLIL